MTRLSALRERLAEYPAEYWDNCGILYPHDTTEFFELCYRFRLKKMPDIYNSTDPDDKLIGICFGPEKDGSRGRLIYWTVDTTNPDEVNNAAEVVGHIPLGYASQLPGREMIQEDDFRTACKRLGVFQGGRQIF